MNENVSARDMGSKLNAPERKVHNEENSETFKEKGAKTDDGQKEEGQMSAMDKETMAGESESPGDPFAMLIEDHNKVKKNFEIFQDEQKKDKFSIVEETILALTVHTKLEEELVYPLLKRNDEDMMHEAEEEHRVVDFVITELKELDAQDEKFKAKFKVLTELVKHHIKEEEGEMFPELRELDLDFDELARKMRERKAELEEEYSDLDSVEPLQSTVTKGHRTSSARKRPTRKSVSARKGTQRKSVSTSKSKSRAGGKTASSSSAKKSAAGKKGSSKRSNAKTAAKRSTGARTASTKKLSRSSGSKSSKAKSKAGSKGGKMSSRAKTGSKRRK